MSNKKDGQRPKTPDFVESAKDGPGISRLLVSFPPDSAGERKRRVPENFIKISRFAACAFFQHRVILTAVLNLHAQSGQTGSAVLPWRCALQKRSHKLLAQTLLDRRDGFRKKRYELAFLFGSFQPDCNPLSYLKGSLRAQKFMGHNFSNSHPYIERHIAGLQRSTHWTMWQYYTLGKLTHYLADAFTFPHNETYTDSLLEHRRYEDDLRLQFARYLADCAPFRARSEKDVADAIHQLHQQYLAARSDLRRDIRFILAANELLMSSVLPQAA